MYKSLYFYGKIWCVLALVGFSVVANIFYYYLRDLVDYSQVANYYPPSVTCVCSRDGKLIEQYAFERQLFVLINSVLHSMIEVFISAEDKNFLSHPGVNILGIIRAAIFNISNLLHHRRMEGGSTVTQQVVKNSKFQ